MDTKTLAASEIKPWDAVRAAMSFVTEENPDTLVVLGQLGVGAAVIDAEGRLLHANAQLLDFLGAEKSDRFGSAALDALVAASVPEEGPSKLGASGFSVVEHTERAGHRVRLRLKPVPLKDGNLLLTVQAELPRVPDERHECCREAERLHREFVSIVSHEIRTPLASMLGGLGLLASGRTGTLPAAAQRMLQIANESSQRLVRLVNDLLDIHTLESGEMPFSLQEVCAFNAMQHAAETMRQLADECNIRITTHGKHLKVLGDYDRLVQVLTNLLSNAIKFSPANSAVHVSCELHGLHAVFAVKDHGRGIPAEKLPFIFDKFAQVQIEDGSQKGGTGLGLAISRNIIERQQGHIWAESTPEKGTTVFFSLPLAAEPICQSCSANAPGRDAWNEIRAIGCTPSFHKSAVG